MISLTPDQVAALGIAGYAVPAIVFANIGYAWNFIGQGYRYDRSDKFISAFILGIFWPFCIVFGILWILINILVLPALFLEKISKRHECVMKHCTNRVPFHAGICRSCTKRIKTGESLTVGV